MRRNIATAEYEPIQPYFLLTLAEKVGCGTFLDIGANIGAYSLFASLVPSIERIVAFEANPEAAAEIKANAALNAVAVEVHAKAVSSEPGRLSFGVVSAYSGANSVVETTIHERSVFHKQIDVEAVTLDDMFPRPFDRPLCIKIDVEGHEARVMQGGANMFRTNQAIMQIEGYRDRSSSLEALGYFPLTSIGPDRYVTNIESLRDPSEVITAYEGAVQRIIDGNHRAGAITLKRGDVALQLTGRTAALARRLAKRLLGRRL
jgi:FkbM family methyltransferase